ncbi:MAG: sulfite exporter TauE/SafE family protein [Puniceicoccaceae bacterium]
MDLSGGQWIAACAAAFGVGLGKGGLPGLGNLAIAVYALAFPARLSVGILLPVLIAADLVAVIVYRRHARWRVILRLLPWTCGGLALGALVFGSIGDRTVEILIGMILLGMTGLHLLRETLRDGDPAPPGGGADTALRAGTGLIGGFATMIANAAGPVAALYLLFLRLPKIAFVGTLAWFFMIVNWLKLPVMIGLGAVNFDSLGVSLPAAAFAMAGVLAARAVVGVIPQKLFEWLIWIFVIGAGFQLLFQPFGGG